MIRLERFQKTGINWETSNFQSRVSLKFDKNNGQQTLLLSHSVVQLIYELYIYHFWVVNQNIYFIE